MKESPRPGFRSLLIQRRAYRWQMFFGLVGLCWACICASSMAMAQSDGDVMRTRSRAGFFARSEPTLVSAKAKPRPHRHAHFRRKHIGGKDPSKELKEILAGADFRVVKANKQSLSWAGRIGARLRGFFRDLWRWLMPKKKKNKLSQQQRKRDPNWFDRLMMTIGKWLQSIGGFFGWLGEQRWLWWVLGAGLLFFVVRLVWRLWQTEKPQKVGDVVSPGEALEKEEGHSLLDEEPESLWKDALALAQQGQFRRAIRQQYLALLLELHRGGCVSYEPASTNREYLEQMRRHTMPFSASFDLLTQVFDPVWYGHHHCAGPEFEQCHQLSKTIIQQMTTHET